MPMEQNRVFTDPKNEVKFLKTMNNENFINH
jgi:hypothetical protein